MLRLVAVDGIAVDKVTSTVRDLRQRSGRHMQNVSLFTKKKDFPHILQRCLQFLDQMTDLTKWKTIMHSIKPLNVSFTRNNIRDVSQNTLSFLISLPRWRRRGPRLQAPALPNLKRPTQHLSNKDLWVSVIPYLRSNSGILHMRIPRRRKRLDPVNHEIYVPTFSGRRYPNHRHEGVTWTLPTSSNSLVK